MTVTISASLVKELRDETNVGMMECKKALQEACGDKDKAFQLLRERGLAIASKKAERTASDGLIAAQVSDDGKSGAMVEVNCETDFVARNETFQAFVNELLQKAAETDENLAETCKDELVAKIAEIGENLIINRHIRYKAEGAGTVAQYIHLGGKVGVLLEVGCENDATTTQDTFKELVKDLCLHVAFANPVALDRSGVDGEAVEAERALFAKQAEGKPADIVEKIVEGKINKYYAQHCLLEQTFVKDSDLSITGLLESKGKDLGDTLTIRRYQRYQIGG